MDIVQPKIIQSPISGEPIRPTIRTYIQGNQEITEAIYTDPASGIFVHKGVVSIKDLNKQTKN
jgi:hypothetical protein